MIRRKQKSPPINYLRTPSPEPWSQPHSSTSSDCDADDEDTMSMEDVGPSPPLSMSLDESKPSFRGYGPYHPPRPTLPDVLSNSAPPPWTLSAFTAYLSQNHCLENLEFTLDADRYKDKYDAMIAKTKGALSPDLEDCKHLRMLWKRIVDAYIVPDCAREINIPSDVRETLLSLPYHTLPPSPEALRHAVKIIYNLMEESVLIPFLNEAPPSSKAIRIKQSGTQEAARRKRGGSDSSQEKRTARSKSKRRGSPIPDSPFSSSDPTGRLTPAYTSSKGSRARSATLSTNGEPDPLTDDSGSTNSPFHEPMTPPETPPSSDFGGSSPKSRPDNTWKKMLGWKKKSGTSMRENRFN
ncbi:uncharacterized protein KY384_006845 [Bacidia gigantensis]|uniref:uncharacterized protein n=1 Tax=Bacidia gigantensis TaxID=2732470 RepID=UPI001D0460FA|nr:uncharacterized protein KY384_006845 [Bacidia gigantensis]KAG8527929.1 hypothetical protein KY384_006845 [Bacidia gigantensis]